MTSLLQQLLGQLLDVLVALQQRAPQVSVFVLLYSGVSICTFVLMRQYLYFCTQVSVFVLLYTGVSICTLVLLLRQLLGQLADVLVAQVSVFVLLYSAARTAR